MSPSPRDFTLAKEDGNSGAEHAGEQFSAVDYDPSLDRREDQQKRFGIDQKVETIVVDGDGDEMGVEEEEEEEEDVDDMFAISTTNKKAKKAKVSFKTYVGNVNSPSMLRILQCLRSLQQRHWIPLLILKGITTSFWANN